MKKIMLVIVLITFYNIVFAQNNIDLLIPKEYQDALCDYQDLLDEKPNEHDRREDLYLKLLGMLLDLGQYRADFLQKEELIDLFPTVYFHVTAQEMINLAEKEYRHPIEKMSQMLAFYDAYKKNRTAWDTGKRALVENHWVKQFEEAARNPNILLVGIKTVLQMGIEAHVDYDLPRAIKYTYLQRSASVTADALYTDFKKTDIIFDKAVAYANLDLKKVYWPDPWIDIGHWLFGGSTSEDVRAKRNRAFIIAVPKCNVDKIQKTYDKSHPEYHYYEDSFKICNPKTDPNCTIGLVFETMQESAQFIVPTQSDWLPVIECKNTIATNLGRVVTNIDESSRRITNYTVAGNHILHPGQITRSVLKKDDAVYVKTIGEGIGAFPKLNEWFSTIVWLTVDSRLRERVKDKLIDINSPCRPFCLAPQPRTNHSILLEKGRSFCNSKPALSLFLFDTSGSMGEPSNSGMIKINEAVNSALSTLQTIEDNSQLSKENPQIGVMSFGGPCSISSVKEHLDFSNDFKLAKQTIGGIRSPSGATPLPTAIEVAEKHLADKMQSEGLTEGKLIILSDGESTCGRIRPDNVYANDIQILQQSGLVTKIMSGASQKSGNGIQFFTVGFNILPGSPAERDLQ